MRVVSKTKIGPHITKTVYADVTQDDMIADLERTRDLAGDASARRYFERQIEEAKKRGRKPKPEHKRRDFSVHARFTPAEAERLERLRAYEDEEMAVLVRELALEAAEARLAKIGE